MTDQGWGCLFAVGVYAIGATVSYFIGYFVLGWLGLGSPHQVPLSLLFGVAAALGLHSLLTSSEKS